MILKAGTYTFNTIPFEPYTPFVYYDHLLPIYAQIGDIVIDGEDWLTFSGYETDEMTQDEWQGYIEIGGELVYENGEWLLNYNRLITINMDTEVPLDYFNFFTSITNYNEVNAKPLAEITYNGETIAELNAGETATLSCEGKKMASDVVVKVNEVESKIPEGYIKPEGTLELVFNNIEAEFPIDCSQYAKVTVNTAEPLKISDPTVLDNITDSPWGVGGSVFLYEGATTDSYEKGALYYLEDTDK